MRRKYKDCQRDDGNCSICSLVSYGRDCHNRALTPLEWHRRARGLTQQELADASGIHPRQIQKIELGEINASNISLANACGIAHALDIEPIQLLGEEVDPHLTKRMPPAEEINWCSRRINELRKLERCSACGGQPVCISGLCKSCFRNDFWKRLPPDIKPGITPKQLEESLHLSARDSDILSRYVAGEEADSIASSYRVPRFSIYRILRRMPDTLQAAIELREKRRGNAKPPAKRTPRWEIPIDAGADVAALPFPGNEAQALKQNGISTIGLLCDFIARNGGDMQALEYLDWIGEAKAKRIMGTLESVGFHLIEKP